jgi:predicted metal-dependent hydrolase
MNKETFINDGHNLLKVLNSEVLDKLLLDCLDNYFPELRDKNIKIGYVISTKDFGGAKAGKWVILFLPDNIPLTHSGLKYIVIHELCHIKNLHNPNKLFKKKVSKEVWEMWEKLERGKELICDSGWTKFK